MKQSSCYLFFFCHPTLIGDSITFLPAFFISVFLFLLRSFCDWSCIFFWESTRYPMRVMVRSPRFGFCFNTTTFFWFLSSFVYITIGHSLSSFSRNWSCNLFESPRGESYCRSLRFDFCFKPLVFFWFLSYEI